MDWMASTGGAPSMVLIPLGIRYNSQYYISTHCLCEYSSFDQTNLEAGLIIVVNSKKSNPVRSANVKRGRENRVNFLAI
jgi:hypothetical protein